MNDTPATEAKRKSRIRWVTLGEKPHAYAAGSWGPAEADLLLENDGRRWKNTEPEVHIEQA